MKIDIQTIQESTIFIKRGHFKVYHPVEYDLGCENDNLETYSFWLSGRDSFEIYILLAGGIVERTKKEKKLSWMFFPFFIAFHSMPPL